MRQGLIDFQLNLYACIFEFISISHSFITQRIKSGYQNNSGVTPLTSPNIGDVIGLVLSVF